MNMERAISADEKLRRAEEIYYRRRENLSKQGAKTVNVPVSNRRYVLKKMIIQIVICLSLYCSYYVIKNFNFIFSKEVVNKTNEILSYDINVQELYGKATDYIENLPYFKPKDEKTQEIQENQEETQKKDTENTDDLQTESANTETPTDEVNVTNVESSAEASLDGEVVELSNNLTQMEIDANDIKQNYSLINPLVGQITYRFGKREQTEPIVSPYHVGIDIASNTGTIIVASLDGNVVASGEIGGYGNCVQIQKDDILTIYGHCSKLYVNKGDVIEKGQQIAEVGQTRKCNRTTLAF